MMRKQNKSNSMGSSTFSLMWASLILFSSVSHHLCNAAHPVICSFSRLVSCCMLSGKDSMLEQYRIRSSCREVRLPMICRLFRFVHHDIFNRLRDIRSPTDCGSAVILSQSSSSSDCRELGSLVVSCNAST